MYLIENLNILWHPEITAINGLPDIPPDSIATQYINAASCDRIIAARFLQPVPEEGEKPVEWLMQRPRGQRGTGRVVFAWVLRAEVENIGVG